jgi:muconolactone delta-isomerase
MKILALEQDVAGLTDEDFKPHLKAESARVWQLYQAGVLRELYFRADRHSAVLILECDGTEEAEAILSTLPLVELGLITFETIPLIAYPGFARLFAEEKSQ